MPTDARRRPLLDAILADPRDTRARMVYADLLQSEGDPRGELVVMQLTRAELADGDPRAAEIDAASAKLVDRHKKTWIAAFGESKGARWEFRRGFCEKLSMDLAQLVTVGAAILADEPVEELSIWKIGETDAASRQLAAVLGLPGIARIVRLSLARSPLGPAHMAVLVVAGPALRGLELLDLSACNMGEDGITVLAGGSFPALRELRLGTNQMGDDGLATLCRANAFPRLERLILTRCDLHDRAGAALASATFAPTLAALDLSSNEMLGDGSMAALAGPESRLVALRRLRMEYCYVTEASVPVILGSAICGALAHLDLSQNVVGAERAALIAKFGDRVVFK